MRLSNKVESLLTELVVRKIMVEDVLPQGSLCKNYNVLIEQSLEIIKTVSRHTNEHIQNRFDEIYKNFKNLSISNIRSRFLRYNQKPSVFDALEGNIHFFHVKHLHETIMYVLDNKSTFHYQNEVDAIEYFRSELRKHNTLQDFLNILSDIEKQMLLALLQSEISEPNLSVNADLLKQCIDYISMYKTEKQLIYK